MWVTEMSSTRNINFQNEFPNADWIYEIIVITIIVISTIIARKKESIIQTAKKM
jgi:hypothetical protein